MAFLNCEAAQIRDYIAKIEKSQLEMQHGSKIRVLFITRKWPPAVGGMETYSCELVKTLKARCDMDVRRLPGRRDGRPPSLPSLAWFGIRTAVSLLARPVRADVIHGGDLVLWPLLWIAQIRNRRARIIISAHGTDIALAHRRGTAAAIYSAYLRRGTRLLPGLTVLANSRATADLCRASGFADVRVIFLATHLPAETNSAPGRYLFFFGRLLAQKGCAWFIRNVLPRLSPDIKLLVAGTVWDSEEGNALEEPRVEFLGRKTGDELQRLCRTALAVVIPNIDFGMDAFEGFGLSAIEAAAAGGVVLASRCYGLEDAIVDTRSGFLLPPSNAEAWASKIDEIAHWSPAQREEFIKRSRRSIGAGYSWPRVADETIRAYA